MENSSKTGLIKALTSLKPEEKKKVISAFAKGGIDGASDAFIDLITNSPIIGSVLKISKSALSGAGNVLKGYSERDFMEAFVESIKNENAFLMYFSGLLIPLFADTNADSLTDFLNNEYIEDFMTIPDDFSFIIDKAEKIEVESQKYLLLTISDEDSPVRYKKGIYNDLLDVPSDIIHRYCYELDDEDNEIAFKNPIPYDRVYIF